MHRFFASDGAFTLVELLATIVLLALVCAFGAVGLSGASDAAKLDGAAAVVMEADRSARLLARQHGSLIMESALGGSSLLIRSPVIDERVREYELPHGTSVRFVAARNGELVHSLELDDRGRGIDYSARVLRGNRSIAWSVAGLTGWTTKLDGASP